MPAIHGKHLSGILKSYFCGPDHPMKMRLWGWLRSALGYPRLTIRYAGQGWITVDERDLLQRRILVTGSYESEVWEALAPYVRAGDVIWDVGAHIGSFAIRALVDKRVAEVHAFEPDPSHHSILLKNLALNCGRYSTRSFALSDRRETRDLCQGPLANTGLSTLDEASKNRKRCRVECRTMDELVFAERLACPNVIKIDVEGWELHVLRGGRRVFEEWPPRALVVEARCTGSGRRVDPNIEEFLETNRYSLTRIERPSGPIEERENYLAVHRSVVESS